MRRPKKFQGPGYTEKGGEPYSFKANAVIAKEYAENGADDRIGQACAEICGKGPGRCAGWFGAANFFSLVVMEIGMRGGNIFCCAD